MAKLGEWLNTLGLERYADLLAENDVDYETLFLLKDEDFKELGLSLGHRRKLLAALAAERLPSPEIAAKPTPAPEDEPSRDAEREAERRQLTVLFCDLADSTALSESLDPEDLRTILGLYHDAVAATVKDNGGHVAKLLGDGVLAYFGWPEARENAAECAVRAGLAAVEAVRSIEAAGRTLAARVGIATGPVVVGDATSAATSERGAIAGATPNLAARLQSEAERGEVVIHHGTRRLIGSSFEMEAAGERALKGFAAPVAMWRVTGIARTESRFDALHGGTLTEFVGREHEIGLLNDRWRQARGGEGQIVLLSGEAGIGKSRILREVASGFASEDCTVLRLQCSPHEVNAAFAPAIAEIEATAGLSLEADPLDRLAKLETHLAEMFEHVEEVAPLFAALLRLPTDRYEPVEMGPQRRKQQTVAFLAERVARLAAKTPVVILFEDVHWIDPSTLEALQALVPRVEVLPILIVVTHRPEFSNRWAGYGHVTAHSLGRLGRGDRRMIAERVARGKALPAELLERIVVQTDGVPLFVEELTKSVIEANLLEERGDRYVLTGPLPALGLPSTLHDSLMARLDRLAPVRGVIQAAACIGREFDADLLGAALAMARESLDHALAQLTDAQLIFPRGGADTDRYVFKHALVQDAAYGSLLSATRQNLHGKLAEALARQSDPDVLALARHRAEAGQHAEAARLYLDAGRRSLAVNALPEAVGALELGLVAAGALQPSADQERLALDLRVALGTARMACFGWAHPSVAEAFEPAFTLAASFGDEDAFVSILWGLWVHYQTRTDFPQAHSWLARLKTVASEMPQSDLPAVYDMSAGCQSFWEADYDRAVAHTDHLRDHYCGPRHSRLAALTNHDPLVFAQHWAGSLADWIRGHPDRSVARMDEAIDIARRVGHPFNLAFALTAGTTSLLYLDEIDRLLAFCDEAQAIVTDEALGPFSERVMVMQWRGGALVQRGEYETGHALLRRGNDFWNESGGRVCNAMFRSWIVRGLTGLGRVEEAAALNVLNIAHCRETGDRYMLPECLRLQGELALSSDVEESARAERLFREALDTAREHRARSWELRAATSLARLLIESGRKVEAVSCLEPVTNGFAGGATTRDLARAIETLDSAC
ncbi:AAA family ATPase [Acuticoccus kandeliae]|uniref:AAA family ATPase n=1 Tax=Acuticoccus kandeliae TaxID=2073160 RepID=UPI000D3EB1E2|nr:AAA family ATPase [Acuticoccus kandeliae]